LARARPINAREITATDDVLQNAAAAWRRLGRADRIRTVRELVEAHCEELTAAYAGVLGVSFGWRTRGRGARQIVIREPCVGFLVGHKRRSRTAADRARELPKVILAYAAIDDIRTLVAVPTDVVGRNDAKSSIRPQNREIVAEGGAAGNRKSEQGVVTCAVRIPGKEALFAMSCWHVLGISRHFRGGIPKNAVVMVDGRRLGRASAHRGKLQADLRYSFDAALARVDHGAVELLRTATPKRGWGDALSSLADLPDVYASYTIFTPGPNVRARWVRTWATWSIDYPGIGQVIQKWLVESEVLGQGRTRPGYSGSPVFGRRGRDFLGMHIAGGGKRAFMIPATQLLDGAYYSGLSASDRLELQVEF